MTSGVAPGLREFRGFPGIGADLKVLLGWGRLAGGPSLCS
jgi:hypothetical protein